MSQCYEFNYTANQPQLLPSVWIACPIGDDCRIGIDTCLSNNLCWAYSGGKEKRAGSYSGYHNARCRDPTYTNPACDKICIDLPPDLVYNYTSQQWACCGNDIAGDVTCSSALSEHYDVPALALLATLTKGAVYANTATLTPINNLPTVASSTFASFSSMNLLRSESNTSSTNSLSSATTTPSQSTQARTPNGLSPGAKAGIGIGVVVSIILFIVALLILLRYRKLTERDDLIVQEMEMTQPRPRHEVANTAQRIPAELDAPYDTVNSSKHGFDNSIQPALFPEGFIATCTTCARGDLSATWKPSCVVSMQSVLNF